MIELKGRAALLDRRSAADCRRSVLFRGAPDCSIRNNFCHLGGFARPPRRLRLKT
jgi:hypothetical protein